MDDINMTLGVVLYIKDYRNKIFYQTKAGARS